MKITTFKGRFYFLSNLYPCKIEFKGIVYSSVEHFFEAQKIKDGQTINGKYYPSDDIKELICRISDSKNVAKFCSQFKFRKDWNDVKLDILEYGLTEKFKDEDLFQMLLQTGDSEIKEQNLLHENFFGSCVCTKCSDKGENNLGKIVMSIRSNSNQRGKLDLSKSN